MTHVHHIVPRHMGGTDEPSNLIELTVEEHAEAHRVLYETYGKKEDYIAWKGLSKQIGKEEIFKRPAVSAVTEMLVSQSLKSIDVRYHRL